jgi:hypothetical protein
VVPAQRSGWLKSGPQSLQRLVALALTGRERPGLVVGEVELIAQQLKERPS